MRDGQSMVSVTKTGRCRMFEVVDERGAGEGRRADQPGRAQQRAENVDLIRCPVLESAQIRGIETTRDWFWDAVDRGTNRKLVLR